MNRRVLFLMLLLGAACVPPTDDPSQVLDLRIDKAFTFDKFTFSVFLDVQNVYNQKNVEGTIFDYRFREEFQIAGIPFLPVFGVKGSF